LLRKRAGIKDNGKGKSRARDEDDLIPEAVRASVTDQGATGSLSINPTSKQPPLTSQGHINLFADLEEVCIDSQALVFTSDDLDFSMRSLLSTPRHRPSNTSPEIRTNQETRIKVMLLLHLKQTEHRGTLNQRRHTLSLKKLDGEFTRKEIE